MRAFSERIFLGQKTDYGYVNHLKHLVNLLSTRHNIRKDDF